MLKRLTAVRAAAALAVFAYHLGRWDVWSLPPATIGYTGVAFFFVLSGFVLAWGTDPDLAAPTFYRRRFARVWPSHAVMLVVAALVPVVAVGRAWSSGAANLFLVQAWWPNRLVVFGMNGVSWTLACEAFFYAMCPVSLLIGRKLGARARCTVALAALAFEAAIMHVSPDLGSHLPIVRFPEFLVGLLAGLAVGEGWRPRLPVPVAALVVAATAMATRGLRAPLPNVTLTLPFVALVVSLAVLDLQRPDGWLTARWVVLAGEASFAFYLVHELTLINLKPHLGGSGPAKAALVFTASAAGAALLHLGVERPANRLLRDRRRSVALDANP